MKLRKLNHEGRTLIALEPIDVLVRQRPQSKNFEVNWSGYKVLGNTEKEAQRLFINSIFKDWDYAINLGLPNPLFDYFIEVTDYRPNDPIEEAVNKIMKELNG